MRVTRLTPALLALCAALLICGCSKRPAEETPPVETQSGGLEDVVSDVRSTTTLSSSQLELIVGSVALLDDSDENGGTRVTMRSAMGDGCCNCFSLAVELPEGVSGVPGGFSGVELLFNDAEVDFSVTGLSWSATADDDPDDNLYYLRLTVSTDRWSSKDYVLNNGITRTLRLTDLEDADGGVLCEGAWELKFEYIIPGEYVELVQQPIPIVGAVDYSTGEEKVWAELESFLLSDFSAQCSYRLVDKSVSEPMSFGLSYVELQSGQTHFISIASDRSDEQRLIRDYNLTIPVPLEDIKLVHLSEKLTLKVN